MGKLEGEFKKLSKPFYVLEKKNEKRNMFTEDNDEDSEIDMNIDQKNKENSSGRCNNNVEYDIVGVVRQKILFKNRPKPIVNKRSATFLASSKNYNADLI